MDALTNVVAVLILVLILVQADVTQKVQKFLEDLLPATPEEVIASQERVEELKEKNKRIEEMMKEDAPSPEEIEEETRRLALLEKSTRESRAKLAELDKLRDLEKKAREERDAESAETVAVQDEIAKLEALLDETPAPKPDTPTVVNIPNSRPIPNDAKIYHAMVLRGRVHIIDPYTPLELFEEEFKKNRSDWLIERISQKGADKYIYDGVKIAKHFENFDWKNSRGQRIEIRTNPTSNRIQLVITPDLEKGGTPTGELATPGSGYSKAAVVISRDFKGILLFRVSPDSFDTYLEARTLADKANIPAGWEINGAPFYSVTIDDIEVKRLEEPEPRPDNTPRPPGPPPVKPKLD
ncbi:MAG: hypothetical protein ABJ118_04785 [Luteolibacter sp.]